MSETKYTFVPANNAEYGTVTDDDIPYVIWAPITAWRISYDSEITDYCGCEAIGLEGLIDDIQTGIRSGARKTIHLADGCTFESEDSFVRAISDLRKRLKKEKKS